MNIILEVYDLLSQTTYVRSHAWLRASRSRHAPNIHIPATLRAAPCSCLGVRQGHGPTRASTVVP